jgi:hypothetical protein
MTFTEAREMVKSCIRQDGLKVSHFKSSNIDEVANILLKTKFTTNMAGMLGAIRRNKNLSPERRSEIARKAANARWHT